MMIKLIGDYDYNYQQALKKVVNNIQTHYDLNHQIIQGWLDQENFDQWLEKKDRGCYRKIMSKPHPTLDKLLDVTYAETFINEQLFWEKEKCGQIVDEYSNGYIKYCNKHKYLHPNKNTAKVQTQDGQQDHYFVSKNPNEIMEEQIFKIRFNIYLKYNRLLAQVLEHDFFNTYLEKTSQYRVHYLELKPNQEQIVSWLKNHPKSFKSKYASYQNGDDETVFLKIYQAPGDQLPDLKFISNKNFT